MIYRKLHRLIDEIEKQRAKGQILHFLTGDGINDNLFYNVRRGIMSLADSLKQYYLADNDEFDYMMHSVNSRDNVKCYARREGKAVEINFEEMFDPPRVNSALPSRRRSAPTDEEATRSAEQVRQSADDVNGRIERLNELLKRGDRRILIFLENLEWIANLYGDQPENSWMAAMQRWQKARNLLVVTTIKDMELLKKYNFDEEETFISNPSAEEIKYAYLRFLLKNTAPGYRLNLQELDDISHGMSVGRKTLCACMRILHKVLREHPTDFRPEYFEGSVEHNIEEQVSWEKVRLEESTKNTIRVAVDAFMRNDVNDPPLKGFILTGPPGTGKTLIAKALANETKCYFMSPTLADLKGEFVGQSSGKIKRVFAEARGNSPTILFIDEADTVFPSRSLGIGDKDSFTMDMVNQFLQELDGAQTGKQKIFTIAATNRPEAIDSAVKSRLAKEPIKIPLPSKEMRRLIFEDNLSQGDDVFTLRGKIFEDKVLGKSENMSGRDITNFVKKLKSKARERGLRLGNDATTEQLFDEVFQEKEDSFIDDVTSLGIFSRENVVKPSKNKMRLSDIIGYDDLKEKILLQVDYIRADRYRKKQYDDFRIKPQKGVLMYGPPGNGKSVLAEAVAGEYGFYFFKVLSRDFANTLPEEQIKNLERIFTEIQRFSTMTDCPGIVLFFDEFDSLAGQGSLNQVVRGSMLNYISDANGIRSKDSKILFMAATNFEHLIDEAIKRQGRIDAHLFMDNPTEENGRQMLESFFGRDNRMEQVSRTIIDRAYEGLRAEKRDKLRDERLHGLREDELSELDRRIFARQLETESRPSGAELETLYKELKEFAFRAKRPEDSKLTVDENILGRRFRSR